ncbi:hypothetical protein ACIGKQ_16515 [Gordonia sp. NPDC062954]|uniref:hypothetical protein n=1 Tax=unclassified Gordonia (in: high G+C Gram-positive bacteria) TaxID=2657482 RepID=UPI00257F6635|nr:hypothetical protein [Gordonia sp. (in: high G+C Gram-positive bacteria)]
MNDPEDTMPGNDQWWDDEQTYNDTAVYRSAWLLQLPFPAETRSAGGYRLGVHLEYESDINLTSSLSLAIWNELAISLSAQEAGDLAAALLRGKGIIDAEFDAGLALLTEDGTA